MFNNNEVKMEKYFPRDLLDEFKKWIPRKEILAVKGPRQAGKTTLLKMLQEYLTGEKKVKKDNIIFLNFEDREVLYKFSQSPKEYINSFIGGRTKDRIYFFIDEFHYLENGGRILKLLFDIFENVKFIITGSSSLELTGSVAKHLVGRLFSFNLYQLSFSEFLRVKSKQLFNVYQEKNNLLKEFIFNGRDFEAKTDIFANDFKKYYEEYSIWGGYPEVTKAEDYETKRIVLKNIYETYITKDIIELLRINNLSKYRTLLKMLSNQIGSLINYNNLASDTQSYFKEVKRYLSILDETFIISILTPFFTNKMNELKKNPKIYFIDTGIRNFLINNFNELSLRQDMGSLIENTVFLQFKINLSDFLIKYWRTLSKAEVDFVMERGNEIIPIEVKYSALNKEKVSRSFRSFILGYEPPRAVVLTKGFLGDMTLYPTKVKFLPVWYL